MTTALLAFLLTPVQGPSPFRNCQVGYQPEEVKIAMLADSSASEVLVRRASDQKLILRITPSEPVKDSDSGDTLRRVDLSKLSTPGRYYLELPSGVKGDVFDIGSQVYDRPFELAMRMFTGQRCGMAVALGADFPQYKYAACHTELAKYDPSSGREGTRDVSGGWHDAGDYGRYIVNSGISTGTLLWAYELNPKKVSRFDLKLPDHKAGTPDILTEIKWNLDWMLKMQDSDGGVWHKATSANFPGFVMPEMEKLTTLVIGTGSAPFKGTAATADFAAVTAIASRVYRKFDAGYADRCLSASRKAWDWLKANPNSLYARNPKGISTGAYEDTNTTDEREWAAAELFRATGDSRYGSAFEESVKSKPTVTSGNAPAWPSVGAMAALTYALSGSKKADAALVNRIKSETSKACDEWVAQADKNGYLIPMGPNSYYWGSNGALANNALVLEIGYQFSGKTQFRQGAQNILHYLFGRNTFGTSFVTQVGTRWPMHPHHRPSGADKVEQPWPGMLVGGPNSYGKLPPARQWSDTEGSYQTNEIAINWNAPLVFALSVLLK